MEKEEFIKLDIIKKFSDFIMKKNYSTHTYESYISDAVDYCRPKSPNYFMDDPIRQKGREELYALKDETTI